MVASTQLPLRGSSFVDEFVKRSDKLTVKFAQVIAKDNKRKRRCKFVLQILVMPHARFQRDLRRFLDEHARDLFQETAGADVNAISNQKYRYKVLQAAACKGSSTVKEIMLAAGANINAIPAHDKGPTALQSAVERGNSAIMFQLLASQHGQRLATQAMKRHSINVMRSLWTTLNPYEFAGAARMDLLLEQQAHTDDLMRSHLSRIPHGPESYNIDAKCGSDGPPSKTLDDEVLEQKLQKFELVKSVICRGAAFMILNENNRTFLIPPSKKMRSAALIVAIAQEANEGFFKPQLALQQHSTLRVSRDDIVTLEHTVIGPERRREEASESNGASPRIVDIEEATKPVDRSPSPRETLCKEHLELEFDKSAPKGQKLAANILDSAAEAITVATQVTAISPAIPRLPDSTSEVIALTPETEHNRETSSEKCQKGYIEGLSMRPTLGDRSKVAVERVLSRPLLWWPFKEPIRPLGRGMRRFSWECVS